MFYLLSSPLSSFFFFFFNDTATTEIYTLSLHDALPICCRRHPRPFPPMNPSGLEKKDPPSANEHALPRLDRKSTRLNSSHQIISYAVFCLKKKNKQINNSLNLAKTISWDNNEHACA